MVTAETCGKCQYSKDLKDTLENQETEVFWGEHFFFEPKNLSSDEIMSKNLRLSVKEKGIFKNSIVGTFEIDIAQIYFSND